jgi:glyoxylase I family protein
MSELSLEHVKLPFMTDGIHHVAYRCNDAKETVDWYQRVLGFTYTNAFAEDHVPSTGAYDPYMHVFLHCGAGNVLAFFELPNQPDMDRDQNTPKWVQHLAFKVANFQMLKAAKAYIEGQGVDVLGPTYHGIFRSIYFFDPNGHRLELACDIGTKAQYDELRHLAPIMLDEWSQSKTAPKSASWIHTEPGDCA